MAAILQQATLTGVVVHGGNPIIVTCDGGGNVVLAGLSSHADDGNGDITVKGATSHIDNEGNVFISPLLVVLSGSISPEGVIVGSFLPEIVISGALSEPEGYDDYTGEYSVTPSVSAQIIATDDKRMTDDLIVEPIPYAEVSNVAGGTTVTIG